MKFRLDRYFHYRSTTVSTFAYRRSTNCRPQAIWTARGGWYDLLDDEWRAPVDVIWFPIGIELARMQVLSWYEYYSESPRMHVHSDTHIHTVIGFAFARPHRTRHRPFTRSHVNYYFFNPDLSRVACNLTISREGDTYTRGDSIVMDRER